MYLGEVEKLTSTIDDLTRKNVDLHSALTEKKNENQDLRQELNEASRPTMTRALSRRDDSKLQSENELLQDELTELKSKYSTMDDKLGKI